MSVYATQGLSRDMMARGGVLPSKRLLGMCLWIGRIFTTGLTIMGLHF